MFGSEQAGSVCPKRNTLRRRRREMSRFCGASLAVRKLRRRARNIADGGEIMQICVDTSRAVENKRVFVVDDDEVTRAVLQFMLQDENETHDLASLTSAYAKGEQGRPDLLLLGLSVIEAAQAGLFERIGVLWPRTRIVVVSDPCRVSAARALLRSGAHGVLSKPFTVAA